MYTPGPWRLAPTNAGLFIAGAKPGYLAQIHDCGSGDVAANARLIVLAPEMLAALRCAESFLSGFEDCDDPEDIPEALAVVRDLIKRAS